jgi:hypothetical protein
MAGLSIEHRTNSAYDSVLLVEDGRVVGAWDYVVAKSAWESPGDLGDWDRSGVYFDGLEVPSHWGQLVAVKTQ